MVCLCSTCGWWQTHGTSSALYHPFVPPPPCCFGLVPSRSHALVSPRGLSWFLRLQQLCRGTSFLPRCPRLLTASGTFSNLLCTLGKGHNEMNEDPHDAPLCDLPCLTAVVPMRHTLCLSALTRGLTAAGHTEGCLHASRRLQAQRGEPCAHSLCSHDMHLTLLLLM